MKRLLIQIGAIAIILILAIPALAQHHEGDHSSAKKGEHHGDSATVHHRFEDAERWATVFEDPERDEWQKPDYVIERLNVAPDAVIADIGSATGYFTVRLAAAARQGKVYGIDIEPSMVEYLNHRAETEGLNNLLSVLGEPEDPKLPEAVDLVFVCDTYHHIGDRVEYFHRLIERLKPGGRIVNIDFKPGELPVGPKPAHKLKPERVAAEMFAAGYELSETDESLPYQYLQVFKVRPEVRLKSGAVKEDGP